jgi:PAS domain S-box-containing protein
MSQTETPKILIVDDQPRNLDVLEAMLGDMECTLVRATSADEALLCLVRSDFAALVLDIKMPGMNGIELATLVKQRKRSQHVPILFLTAHSANEEDVLRGYNVGAVDFLSKPVNAGILRSKIGVFVELFRKTRALAVLNETLQREVAEREKAQMALEQANHDLEHRVHERTVALSRAHKGVRENEERLRMALEVAQIAAWEWHLASGQMRWSTDPEVLFGFPKGSFGQELRIFRTVHPEDKPRVEEATASALRTGSYESQYRAVRADGGIVWITERGRVFSDADGDRMVGITRDVTAEREAAQERERLLRSEREARDEAERQSRLKEEFLATLSHELRTPLNSIMGWAQLLRSGRLGPDKVREGLDRIIHNGKAQGQLISDLLDVNAIASAKLRLQVQRLPLALPLTAALDSVRPDAVEKGITLLPPESDAEIRIDCDPDRLQQVFWNLLANAVKFTPAGGTVAVAVNADRQRVRIGIADSGCGIEPDFLPRLFERFTQADGSPTRRYGGLGLGLSICRTLVEMHGGEIQAHSDGSGQGSTFLVVLPSVVSGEAPDPSTWGDSKAMGLPPEEEAAALRGLRVLLVDDDAEGRSFALRLLEQYGAVVTESDSADEALRALAIANFGLMISDLGMPGKDGHTLMREVRASPQPALKFLHAVALTAFARREDEHAALEAGFDAYIAKPAEPARIVRTCLRVLAGQASHLLRGR